MAEDGCREPGHPRQRLPPLVQPYAVLCGGGGLSARSNAQVPGPARGLLRGDRMDGEDVMDLNRFRYSESFQPGDSVETVNSGIFSGTKGTVLPPREDRLPSGRILVRLDVFGRSVLAHLEPFQLKRAD
jgi:hypothetical protein